jgi:hypothetical protein
MSKWTMLRKAILGDTSLSNARLSSPLSIHSHKGFQMFQEEEVHPPFHWAPLLIGVTISEPITSSITALDAVNYLEVNAELCSHLSKRDVDHCWLKIFETAECTDELGCNTIKLQVLCHLPTEDVCSYSYIKLVP